MRVFPNLRRFGRSSCTISIDKENNGGFIYSARTDLDVAHSESSEFKLFSHVVQGICIAMPLNQILLHSLEELEIYLFVMPIAQKENPWKGAQQV